MPAAIQLAHIQPSVHVETNADRHTSIEEAVKQPSIDASGAASAGRNLLRICTHLLQAITSFEYRQIENTRILSD